MNCLASEVHDESDIWDSNSSLSTFAYLWAARPASWFKSVWAGNILRGFSTISACLLGPRVEKSIASGARALCAFISFPILLLYNSYGSENSCDCSSWVEWKILFWFFVLISAYSEGQSELTFILKKFPEESTLSWLCFSSLTKSFCLSWWVPEMALLLTPVLRQVFFAPFEMVSRSCSLNWLDSVSILPLASFLSERRLVLGVISLSFFATLFS